VEARFSAPLQTGPEAHPAYYTMGTGSFSGVKRPGRGVDHTPPFSAEVKERVKLYLYSPSGSSWPVLECTLTLPLAFTVYVSLDSRKFNTLLHCCLTALFPRQHVASTYTGVGPIFETVKCQD